MHPENFDWKHPDYVPIMRQRLDFLYRIRSTPGAIDALKVHYRDHIADFIEDWGVTENPQNAEVGLPTTMPFILFPAQREWVGWFIERWRNSESGLTEKSRECGMSWLAIAVGASLCIFHHGFRIGFGSRKEEYVDKIDEPKSLFWKARFFLRHLPTEFRAGWREGYDSPHMRMKFPETGSSMTGEGGDDIGRGDRTSIYVIDEAAHLKRPMLAEASLMRTTNCRIDISSVNGPNNVFAQKRHSGRVPVFIFDWRDDPRKDEEWYRKQVAEFDPIIVAQEIDRDYSASIEGVLLPRPWLNAAIDAREKLGLAPVGMLTLAFDVADEGVDRNAVAITQGISVDHVEDWAGKGSDIFASVERVFEICDERGIRSFRYDADGLGAGVRGDARIINERRKARGQPVIDVEAYRGSADVLDPDGQDVKGRTNLDYFKNRKAQTWWRVRAMFQRTHRWVVDRVACDPTSIISISSKCPSYLKLIAELGQVTYRTNDAGQIVIEKTPDGMKSPNLADAVVICKARGQPGPLRIPAAALARAKAARAGIGGIGRIRRPTPGRGVMR